MISMCAETKYTTPLQETWITAAPLLYAVLGVPDDCLGTGAPNQIYTKHDIGDDVGVEAEKCKGILTCDDSEFSYTM